MNEEVLDERPQTVFDASEAATALDELRARVNAEPTTKLTISWRLTRPKPGGRA